jgi:hypothetical protein
MGASDFKLRLGADEVRGLFIGNEEVIRIYYNSQVIYDESIYLYSHDNMELTDKNGLYLAAADGTNN